jgi:hypothetical protein
MQFTNTIKVIASYVLATGTGSLFAQQNTVNAICSTDQAWCEMAAQEYTRATGAKVLQTRKDKRGQTPINSMICIDHLYGLSAG